MDGQFFDPFSPFDDGGVAAEVGIGGRDVAEALVVAVVVIVIEKSADLAFKVSGQKIIFQQDAVFQGLVVNRRPKLTPYWSAPLDPDR